MKKVLLAPAKDDTWFKYNITVQGNHVVVKIDDKVVADYTEDAAELDKDKSIEPQRLRPAGSRPRQHRDVSQHQGQTAAGLGAKSKTLTPALAQKGEGDGLRLVAVPPRMRFVPLPGSGDDAL